MIKLTTVVNMNCHSYDIYIGRGSPFGNPFKIGKDGNRKEVIEKYKKYLLSNDDLLLLVEKLKGKILGCFCKPKACHGDVICELLNKKNFNLKEIFK